MTLISARISDDDVWADSDKPVAWWSVAKTAIAAAALKLVGNSGNGAVLQLCPADFGLSGVSGTFSLKSLLQHTARLPDYGSLPAYHRMVANRSAPWPLAEMIERTLKQDAPDGWHYSNLGYAIVRQFIETEARNDLETALNELLFAPIGITDVTVASAPQDLSATAWGNPTNYHPGYVYHGLLASPAVDAARFIHELMHGRIPHMETLQQMRDPVPVGGPIQGRIWQAANYGLGVMIGAVDIRNERQTIAGHSGSGPVGSSAVYHLNGVTGAAFSSIADETSVEFAALHQAAGLG